MSQGSVLVLHSETIDQVRVLRLDRSERLNAFDDRLYDAVADAIGSAAADPAVRVVVITGTGRAFSAGADLKALAEPGAAARYGPAFDRMLDAFASIDKPVVAAVNGLAVGVGTTLLLHCDLVLADEGARFRTPFVELGTTPEAGSSMLFTRAVGPQFANWMLLTGEWVDARTAAAAGLVARVCAAGTVVDEALEVARRLAAHSPAALAASKRLIRSGLADLVLAARRREAEERRTLPGGGSPRRSDGEH
jgi:enoyl-CoA hydratase/carnithine racemase